MKKLIYFTTGFILFLIFLVPAILSLGIKLIPTSDQPNYSPNYRLSIYGEREVTQKFVSGVGNLSAIGTSIRNPNLKNKKEIIFSLYNEKMELVRTVALNGLNIEDGSFIKIVFDPIPDSKGKTYIFRLSSPGAGPEETIEVFISETPPGFLVEYVYDGEVRAGGIPIVLYYRQESKIEVVKEIYSNLFSRLLLQNSQTP